MARLLANTLSGSGYLTRFVFSVEPVEGDILLPPFTGRVTKSIVANMDCMRPLWKMYRAKSRFKPVTFKALRDRGGRPLYKRDGGGKPLELRRNRPLFMEVTVYSPEALLLPCRGEEVGIGYGRVAVDPVEASIAKLETLSKESYDTITIRILTPMTISSKIMMPPVPPGSRVGRLLLGAREMYRLLPTPGYILAQALRQWLGVVNNIHADTMLHYYFGRIADLLLAEVDYRLRPETVLYGKDDNGNELKVRGVTGYMRLAVLEQGIKWAVSRLLGLAEYLGLGKSRSIGFGEVRVLYE